MSRTDLPFSLDAVILCEDVRVEASRKMILIGVYAGNIKPSRLPATLRLCLWMSGRTKKLGNFKIDMQILDDNSRIIQSTSEPALLTNSEMSYSTLNFAEIPVRLESTGIIKFQVRVDSGNWETVLTKDVVSD